MSPALDAVLVAAHPVRTPGGDAGLRAVARALAALTPGPWTLPAFLDADVRPSLDEALRACAARGARSIAVLPLLVAGATLRVQSAVLEGIGRVGRRWSVSVRFAPTLGDDPALADLVLRRFLAARPSPGTGLLVVAHGRREPGWDGPVRAVTARVAVRLPRIPTETAFLEHTAPDIATGVDALVRRGARAIVAVPYFLHVGRHVQEDVPRLLQEAASRHPGLGLGWTPPLAEPTILASVLRRRLEDVTRSTRDTP